MSKTIVISGLKPCPFCGGNPVLKQAKTLMMQCDPCRLVMWMDNPEQAKKKWNRRRKVT